MPAVFAKESANSRLLDGYHWSALFGTSNPADGTLLDSKIRDGSISGNKLQPAAVNIATLAKEVTDLLTPPGCIMAFGGQASSVPLGWLLCDGRALSGTEFPRLFAAIGTAWGNGSTDSQPNTTFNLPDLRGRFLRGVDGGSGLDPDAASRFASAPSGNTGNAVGSIQGDLLGVHQHSVNLSGSTSSSGAHSHNVARSDGVDIRWGDGGGSSTSRIDSADTSGADPLGVVAQLAGVHSHQVNLAGNTTTAGSNETRPKNAYVLYIIRH